ncbi:MAG: alanine dehydrogenase [Bacteroidetes bacterium B1(2017)]|nr:MAG: alanine dehydrogenase [Bacteroidetes bacterium B1(2017)]
MGKIIGIIREGKKPEDLRTPLTPQHCVEVMNFFPGTRVLVQPSPFRCFSDEQYVAAGVEVKEDLSECDILMGVKEVPADQLLANKTYLFFSHTIKKQSHNRNLLRTILAKNITLIDYETLTWEAGNRIIGFGRFAGIVGTHYAFLMLGKKYGYYTLKPANELANYAELLAQYQGLKMPPVRIVLCGDGRVAHGCIELLRKLRIHQVSQEEFLEDEYNKAIFVHLRSEDYYERKDGKPWDKSDFYKHPEDYRSCFKPYYQKADIMLNSVFWKDGIEEFFTHEEMKDSDFRIKVISDITCDVPGPIPSTVRSTTINNPFYGYNVYLEKEVAPFQPNVIDVQAVGNLPCELPFDASIEFGEQLVRHVLPNLLIEDKDHIIHNATIAKDGKLMEKFLYLADYVN